MLPSPLPFRQSAFRLRQAGRRFARRVARRRPGRDPHLQPKHPNSLDDKIPWLARFMSREDAAGNAASMTATRSCARAGDDFYDWAKSSRRIRLRAAKAGPVQRFERAGRGCDWWRCDHAVSTCFATDPHRRTLLDARQPLRFAAASRHAACTSWPLTEWKATDNRSPERCRDREVAARGRRRSECAAGIVWRPEHDHGGMPVSSTPPRKAGEQVPLVEVLFD